MGSRSDPTRKYLIKSSGAIRVPVEEARAGDLAVSHVPVDLCPALITSVVRSKKGVINKGRLLDINVVTCTGTSYTAVLLECQDDIWVVRSGDT